MSCSALPRQDGEGHEWHGEDTDWGDAQTITKEMDIDHLQHAGFDPEAAAYEDGVNVEDLGYDEDPGGCLMLLTLPYLTSRVACKLLLCEQAQQSCMVHAALHSIAECPADATSTGFGQCTAY